MINFTAADSFDVILGEPSGTIFGGGARVGLPIGGLFVDVGAWRFRGDGERVFVFDGQEFPLGIPVEVTITPLELSAGWQFRFRRAAEACARTSAGGYTSYGYQETSRICRPTPRTSTSGSTAITCAAAPNTGSTRWLGLGGELTWTTVPDAIGESAACRAEFDETDLGGTSFRFKITIGR